MQEDFLHYVWKFQKFNSVDFYTTDGQAVTVLNVGQHNKDSGPDFFNSQVRIGDQLWAGNVEIHINSSDWFIHNHEIDSQYDNVILHVVYNHDTEIFRKDNSVIPTLALKEFLDKNVEHRYNKLLTRKKTFINCENDLANIDQLLMSHWLERLYVERLESKSNLILDFLKTSNNDWEAVLFKMLAKNFGLKVNGDAFLNMAQSLDFSIIRKLGDDSFKLEALFFGQLNLYDEHDNVPYSDSLKREYLFIKNKYGLENSQYIPVKFFRLRPQNFPTIRLAQLADLYAKNQSLFSKILAAEKIEELYKLLDANPSIFWRDHYTFKSSSKPNAKKLSKAFKDLLIINTILPIKFCYSQFIGSQDFANILELSENIKAESNNVIDGFSKIITLEDSAMITQSLLQLKSNYCDLNRCLHCEIGNSLLKN